MSGYNPQEPAGRPAVTLRFACRMR